ncbi:hypothetical protein HMF8227_02440 [Saliniradius amylolyticus]|uniref:DUF192 domain-containing protein n=1 Tax=Saliniradius amylolyticus TaxID=2183582 RepID=A0A2S2E5S9_9ALTE|nr:DUF192 domain-containing protein [Saliniradius amylolyticus]AWL12892.1 hypothetical protein HMF8227_02440 [Saliniradius amylolyticus]
MKKLLWIVLMALPFMTLAVPDQSQFFSEIEVSVNEQSYVLELAESPGQRARGLMYRESLCEDCGMLFVYSRPRVISMWMKNTAIPLDVAFIKENGEIIAIKQMQPYDLSSVTSEKSATYAWEANQGWFSEQGIKVGDRVEVKK